MFDWIPNVPLIGGAVKVGVGGLQGYGIFNRRLLYKEIVKSRLNFKKSVLWLVRNISCGDSTGSNQIEKDRVRVPPVYILESGEKEWCDLVCVRGAPLDE